MVRYQMMDLILGTATPRKVLLKGAEYRREHHLISQKSINILMCTRM